MVLTRMQIIQYLGEAVSCFERYLGWPLSSRAIPPSGKEGALARRWMPRQEDRPTYPAGGFVRGGIVGA